MPEELFPYASVQMDSPRLAWMKKHNVQTFYLPSGDWPAWCAWPSADELSEYISDNGEHMVGEGETEDEALQDMAIKHGLKLWNEEQ